MYASLTTGRPIKLAAQKIWVGQKQKKHGLAKSRKNMDWPKPKKYGLAKAEKTIGGHIMNHHMVAGAEGARHHVVRGGRRPPLIMWSPIVLFGFGLGMFYWV